MKTINVVLIEDHKLVLEGYKLLLEREKKVKIIAQYSQIATLKERFEAECSEANVVVLDLNMHRTPTIHLITWLVRAAPLAKILVCSSTDYPEVIALCLHNGASGYLTKAQGLSDLQNAITMVHEGQTYLPPQILHSTIRNLAKQWLWVLALTEQERHFLKLNKSILSYKDIATEMKKSIRTIENYRDDLYRKFQVSSRNGLISIAERFLILIP